MGIAQVIVYGQSVADVNGKDRATWSCVTCGGLARAAREVREIVGSQRGFYAVGFSNNSGWTGLCRFLVKDGPELDSWLDCLEAAVADGSVNQVDVGKVRIFVVEGI